MKKRNSRKLLPLLRLRFAPALPLRGTPSGTAYAKRRRSTHRNHQTITASSPRGEPVQAYGLASTKTTTYNTTKIAESQVHRLQATSGLMCFRVAREMSHRVAAIAPFIANSPKNRTNGD